MIDRYTTVAGDMWDGIAYKIYGNERHTDQIMKRNPQYRSILVFPAGIILIMPTVKVTDTTQLPPWKRVRV